MLYAVRGKGHWSGDRTQSTLWQIPSRDQDAVTVHGTQKPVECMRRPMINNSSAGQAIYEPFSGSGTAIIAAESSNRHCLAIELDPAYVDVCVQRWQAFTGKTATLDGDERSFEAVARDRGGGQNPAPSDRRPAASEPSRAAMIPTGGQPDAGAA